MVQSHKTPMNISSTYCHSIHTSIFFFPKAKYRWVNNIGNVVSEQHLYEHTEHPQCLEVTHSPEADIVAFHIPPTVTMSCRLFPSEAAESLLLCVCRKQWNWRELTTTVACVHSIWFCYSSCLMQYLLVPSVWVNAGREGMVFVSLLPSRPPGSVDIRK